MINDTLFYVFKVIFSFILLNSIVKFKKISYIICYGIMFLFIAFVIYSL